MDRIRRYCARRIYDWSIYLWQPLVLSSMTYSTNSLRNSCNYATSRWSSLGEKMTQMNARSAQTSRPIPSRISWCEDLPTSSRDRWDPWDDSCCTRYDSPWASIYPRYYSRRWILIEPDGSMEKLWYCVWLIHYLDTNYETSSALPNQTKFLDLSLPCSYHSMDEFWIFYGRMYQWYCRIHSSLFYWEDSYCCSNQWYLSSQDNTYCIELILIHDTYHWLALASIFLMGTLRAVEYCYAHKNTRLVSINLLRQCSPVWDYSSL